MYPANEWSQTDYLLAALVDLTAGANWQRSGDKNARRPKPVKRPRARQTDETYDEMKARIAAYDEQHRGEG